MSNEIRRGSTFTRRAVEGGISFLPRTSAMEGAQPVCLARLNFIDSEVHAEGASAAAILDCAVKKCAFVKPRTITADLDGARFAVVAENLVIGRAERQMVGECLAQQQGATPITREQLVVKSTVTTS